MVLSSDAVMDLQQREEDSARLEELSKIKDTELRDASVEIKSSKFKVHVQITHPYAWYKINGEVQIPVKSRPDQTAEVIRYISDTDICVERYIKDGFQQLKDKSVNLVIIVFPCALLMLS